MKKTCIRMLAALLAVCLLLTAAPLSGFVGLKLFPMAKAAGIEDEVLIIKYGSYPQSRVTDDALINALNETEKTWRSYDYYSGTGFTNGTMTPSDYMKFADFFYNGCKYRAITLSEYRPRFTHLKTNTTGNDTYQNTLGYAPNEVYYFLYEPIEWIVPGTEDELIYTKYLLDAQPYQNTVYDLHNEYWHLNSKTYSNDYAASSIRGWLNYDFYYTAFTEEQQNNIRDDVTRDCSDPYYDKLIPASVNDKIFLLSFSEAGLISAYFHKENKTNAEMSFLRAKGTEYANSQGLPSFQNSSVYDYGSNWWLRTPDLFNFDINTYRSKDANIIEYDGDDRFSAQVNCQYIGIRPACRLKSIYSDTSISYTLFSEAERSPYLEDNRFQYGTYPQTLVTDTGLIAALDEQEKTWKSYHYYSYTENCGLTLHTGEDGNTWYEGFMMEPSDFMQFADFFYNQEKYRAVYFSDYRPKYTELRCGEDASIQDDNGYYKDTVYYFKYEPITWRVLDPYEGLIVTESAIDAQPFQNTVYDGDDVFALKWQTLAHINHVNDYPTASITDWLNYDFYRTAFNGLQKANILHKQELTNDVTNTSGGQTDYESPATKDKIFLLSYNEAPVNKLTLLPPAQGTDYALCQGLNVKHDPESKYNNCASWWLRSKTGDGVYFYPASDVTSYLWSTISRVNQNLGIRAACRLENLEQDNNTEPTLFSDPNNVYTKYIKKTTGVFQDYLTRTSPESGNTYVCEITVNDIAYSVSQDTVKDVIFIDTAEEYKNAGTEVMIRNVNGETVEIMTYKEIIGIMKEYTMQVIINGEGSTATNIIIGDRMYEARPNAIPMEVAANCLHRRIKAVLLDDKIASIFPDSAEGADDDAYVEQHCNVFSKWGEIWQVDGFYEVSDNDKIRSNKELCDIWDQIKDAGKIMRLDLTDLNISADYYDLFLSDLILSFTEKIPKESIETEVFSLLSNSFDLVDSFFQSSQEYYSWDNILGDGGLMALFSGNTVSDEASACFSTLWKDAVTKRPDMLNSIYKNPKITGNILKIVSASTDALNAFRNCHRAYCVAEATKNLCDEFFEFCYDVANEMEKTNSKFAEWFRNAVTKYKNIKDSDVIMFTAAVTAFETAGFIYKSFIKDSLGMIAYNMVSFFLGINASTINAVTLAWNIGTALGDFAAGIDSKSAHYMFYISPIENAMQTVVQRYGERLLGDMNKKNADLLDIAFKTLRCTNIKLYDRAYTFANTHHILWIKTKSMENNKEEATMMKQHWLGFRCHPAGTQTSSRKVISIQCPVDVYLYSNDQQILAIENEQLTLCEDDLIAVNISNGKKTVCYPADRGYSVRLSAYDAGTMDYSVICVTDDAERYLSTYQIELEEGQTFTGSIPTDAAAAKNAFALQSDGKIIPVDYDSAEAAVCAENGHQFGAWACLQNATLTEEGIDFRSCSVCGYQEKRFSDPVDYLPGDVDFNGDVTAADARIALRMAVGLNQYTVDTPAFLAADVNTDGVITPSDARVILRCALGRIGQDDLPVSSENTHVYAETVYGNEGAHFFLDARIENSKLRVALIAYKCDGLTSALVNLRYDPAVLSFRNAEDGAHAGKLKSDFTHLENNDSGCVRTGFYFSDSLSDSETGNETGFPFSHYYSSKDMFGCVTYEFEIRDPSFFSKSVLSEFSDVLFALDIVESGGIAVSANTKDHLHQWEQYTENRTCTEGGFNGLRCGICGMQYGLAAAPVGHSWKFSAVTRPATAETEGEALYTCTVCGTTRTEPIPKLTDTPTFMLGDVDNDGKVTAGDARLALRRSVDLETYAPGSREFLACDADGDGKVTAGDARLILRAAVGLETLSAGTDAEKEEILRLYKAALADAAANAGYFAFTYSELSDMQGSGNNMIDSAMQLIAESYTVSRDDAEVREFRKGSDEAKNGLPICTLSDTSKIRSAKTEKNGENTVITLVMEDESMPMSATSHIGHISNTAPMWDRDVLPELNAIEQLKSYESPEITYRGFTVTAELTPDGRLAYLTLTAPEIDIVLHNVRFLFINIEKVSVQVMREEVYTGFIY